MSEREDGRDPACLHRDLRPCRSLQRPHELRRSRDRKYQAAAGSRQGSRANRDIDATVFYPDDNERDLTVKHHEVAGWRRYQASCQLPWSGGSGGLAERAPCGRSGCSPRRRRCI